MMACKNKVRAIIPKFHLFREENIIKAMEIVKKVVLVGHFGVGKTSLVKRFVFQKFSDNYLTTIGVKIDKKEVNVEGAQMKMMIWDIAGESTAHKIPKKYLTGAHGVMYVFDLTRAETYQNIKADLFEITKDLDDDVCLVLANKADMLSDDELQALQENIDIPFKITSAKTGAHVEEAFLELAGKMA